MKIINKGLRALTTSQERRELRAVSTASTITLKTTGLRLRRTFNQKLPDGSILKFWRVVGPLGHRSIESDLSLEGLKHWGII